MSVAANTRIPPLCHSDTGTAPNASAEAWAKRKFHGDSRTSKQELVAARLLIHGGIGEVAFNLPSAATAGGEKGEPNETFLVGR